MKTRLPRTSILAAGIVAFALVMVCHAQYALFDEDTDTIAISGETNLQQIVTFEAVVRLSASAQGSLYREQGDSTELKVLALGASVLEGFAKDSPTDLGGFSAAVSITLNVFHHVAFVHNDAERRLYLDGVLVGSQTVTTPSNDIDDASGVHPRSIGASQVNPTNEPVASFFGLLDSVRISNVVRYVGSSFTPPMGDLSADVNTLLLFNFRPQDVSGNTVADLSVQGHTGTFGTGFTGATSPTIVPEPGAAVFLLCGAARLLFRRSLPTSTRNACCNPQPANDGFFRSFRSLPNSVSQRTSFCR